MPVMVNWRRRGTRRSDVAPFVLIHGAYFGGWSWRWVVPYLRDAGHDVYAPSLTGVGERVHLAGPQVDLETHITDVVNLLHYEDVTGVVLVGWSYGGMIVAGVADRVPERIAQIIYFDADVPRDGDTSSPPSLHADKEAQARALGDGWRYPPPFGPTIYRLNCRPKSASGCGSGTRGICSRPASCPFG
jgi:pimeloyl-ACP methyl ester carboxylesterase